MDSQVCNYTLKLQFGVYMPRLSTGLSQSLTPSQKNSAAQSIFCITAMKHRIRSQLLHCWPFEGL